LVARRDALEKQFGVTVDTSLEVDVLQGINRVLGEGSRYPDRSGTKKPHASGLPTIGRTQTPEEGRPMAKSKSYEGFSEEERAAMKARAAELKSSSRGGSAAKKAEAEAQDCLDKIASMPDAERVIAEKVHAIVTATAPELAPKTWYGMPAYARDGKPVLFFKNGSKFKMRYSEVGFSEWAALDDAELWPTAYAVTAMNPKVEKQLTALVKRAVS
jgi:uncharacterized protein YdhG (YjbR/CyaY superfamily)